MDQSCEMETVKEMSDSLSLQPQGAEEDNLMPKAPLSNDEEQKEKPDVAKPTETDQAQKKAALNKGKVRSAKVSPMVSSNKLDHGSKPQPVGGTKTANIKSYARPNGTAKIRAEATKVSEAQSADSGAPAKQNPPRAHSNFTVPQPFALATDKRGQLKPLGKTQVPKEDDKKTLGDKNDDVKSLSSHESQETKSQLRASANTFNFNSDARAMRRKEFNSKLEERLTAKEAEKTLAQVKTKAEIQAEIKKFRKSLTFKATPMPTFYQDATPPKTEIKKIPTTRARSPKLGRRSSTTMTHSNGKAKESSEVNNDSENSKENEVKIKMPRASSLGSKPKKSPFLKPLNQKKSSSENYVDVKEDNNKSNDTIPESTDVGIDDEKTDKPCEFAAINEVQTEAL